MKRGAWNKFVKIRDSYRRSVEELIRSLPQLGSAQQTLISNRGSGSGAAYIVETPIVYNNALDDVSAGDDIRLILAADNPGRREQAAENRRYLVGPSGKIAEKFFRDNPGLGIDFRKNAIILNKTPIHTPRTAELRELCRLGGAKLEAALAGSQQTMARLLLDFHQALADGGTDKTQPFQVWIIGYSEMKKGGIFESYTETLKELYQAHPLRDQIYLYRHFSMNQFTMDLRQKSVPEESLAQNLARAGAAYRRRILGW
jgi:hypothetical protein